MASTASTSELSEHSDKLASEDSQNSPTKMTGPTPLSSHPRMLESAETSDFDSIFGRESTQTPLDSEPRQAAMGEEDYHRDPGEVNIHQFYPILDHSFNRKQSAKSRTSDKEMLLAIAEEDSKSEQTVEESDQGSGVRVPDGEMDPRDATYDGSGTYNFQYSTLSQEQEEQSERIDRTSSMSDQEGVFSTAVDEDTIEEAKLRSHGLFSNIWNGAVKNKSVALTKIVSDRAYEHYQRALERKKENDLVGIITCLNKAINLKTDDPVFYVERAEAYIQLCDFQSAILNYKKTCLLEPRNEAFYSRLAFLYYFHGQTLFDQRLYPEALESFSRASEMVPENVGYHIRSISCLAALQRHGECLALVNKRLETDQDNPDLYVMRAHLHEMFKNTTLCYYDVKDALVLDPDHAEANRMMSEVTNRANVNKIQSMNLNIAGKHREALNKISIAIETDPSVADFHVLRGALHRKLNDFNAAIDDFLLALDKCDHDEEDKVYVNAQRQLLLTYNDFAVECFSKGFYEEAIILLNKAIKGEKTEKSLYVNRGDCFFKQSELTFALQDYHQALELDSVDTATKTRVSVIHNEFGVNLYQEKNYPDSEAKFTLALQYNPQVGQYYISRARARYMMENMTGAREDLLMGLLLSPTNEDIVSILSRLFPGKSISDVINSPAANAARIKLNNLVSTSMPVKLSPIQRGTTATIDTDYASELFEPSDMGEDGVGMIEEGGEGGEEERTKEEEEEAGEPMWKPPPSSKSSFAMCLEEKDFYQQQVMEKRKVEFKVKEALNNRRSLRHEGTRIQPMPPVSKNTRVGSFQGHRQRYVLQSAESGQGRKPPKAAKGTNWKTFSLGIGGLQNV